jgi:hypothetical protein
LESPNDSDSKEHDSMPFDEYWTYACGEVLSQPLALSLEPLLTPAPTTPQTMWNPIISEHDWERFCDPASMHVRWDCPPCDPSPDKWNMIDLMHSGFDNCRLQFLHGGTGAWILDEEIMTVEVREEIKPCHCNNWHLHTTHYPSVCFATQGIRTSVCLATQGRSTSQHVARNFYLP